jgi:integrase
MRDYSEVNHRPSTTYKWRMVFNHHLVPQLGHLRLCDIGPKRIEEYKRDKLAAEIKASSINGHLQTLQRALRVAREWEIIDRVPRISYLRVTEAKFDYLTFQEAEILPAAAKEPWRKMIIVGLKTGLRRGELLGLQREDVDLERGRLTVCHTALSRRLGPPKNGRTRIVPLGRVVHQALATQLRSHPHRFVFSDEHGRTLHPIL